MTEDQARTKWCPMYRLVAAGETQSSYNSIYMGEGQISMPTKCIASDCMMWRWTVGERSHKINPGYTEGLCGLAGDD